MKMRIRIAALLLLSLCSLAGHAQNKYSNEFLSIGIGARGLALSGTYCAMTDDVTSAYWNPAGLARMDKRYQLSLMHAEYFAGAAKYDYAGIGCKIDGRSSVALTYIRFGVDNIMNTTELIDAQGNVDYDRISLFSAADNAVLLDYAYAFERVPGLSLGGGAKIVYRKIGQFANAWGFGLDAGLQFVRKGWQAGLMLRDLTSTFNVWNYHITDQVAEVFRQTGNTIPENATELTLPSVQLGGAKYIDFGKGFNATFALGIDCTFDGKRNVLIRSKALNIDPHLGMEFGYKKIVALRMGIGNLQQETDFDGSRKTTLQINAGLGVCIKNIVTIDYAFTDLGNLSIAQYSHIFSVKVALDRFRKQTKE